MFRNTFLGVVLVIVVPISLVMFKPSESFRTLLDSEKSYRGAGIFVAGTDCAAAPAAACPVSANPIPGDVFRTFATCTRALICHSPGTTMTRWTCVASSWLFYNTPCVIISPGPAICTGFVDTPSAPRGILMCTYAGAVNAACGSNDTCSG